MWLVSMFLNALSLDFVEIRSPDVSKDYDLSTRKANF
ncbi:hypothetical protein PENANT_c274G03808, partial [Penicillium antarcticum]